MRPGDMDVIVAVIEQLDDRLQQHDQFGKSSSIVGRVVERYKFALDVLAKRNARLLELARHVEALDDASADDIFSDILVRAELEAAIGRLETPGPEDSLLEPLCWLLDEALASIRRDPGRCIARRAMGRELVVGPAKRTWVWDLPDELTPMLDRLHDSVRTGFMPGAQSSVEIIRPKLHMIEQLQRACSLLFRLVPHTADSIFQHLRSIAIANIRGPRGRMLTGSGGDGTPCMIFIDPEELNNPWDTAGHILHEGVHLKLSDLIRTSAIVTDDESVTLPWGRSTALSNCIFAFHAYAHMQVFRAAVQHLGPACHAAFGAPHEYRAPAHAMSVVNNTDTSPFARAQERLDYLHAQLAGAWASRVTPYGHALAAWLWDTIRPLEEITGARSPAHAERAERHGPAPASTQAPSSVRYRQNRDVSLRRSPSSEVLFALDPSSHKIVTLNLAAWLAFELCDGKTEQEVLSAYAASLGLESDRAWSQLAAALGQLLSRGMIVRASEGAGAAERMSP